MAGTKKQNTKTAGLGDVVKHIAAAVGIEPCEGCNKRGDFLNVNFAFNKPKHLTEAQRSLLITDPSDENYIEVYNDAFKTDVQDPVKGVLGSMKKKLNKLLEYEPANNTTDK